MARQKRGNYLGFYILLLLLSVYLFFQFGLQLFVDWAFLITQKGSSVNQKTTVSNSKISLISEPILEEMPDATNSAILYLKGQANPDTQIQLFHNKLRVATITTDFEGNFEFEQVLQERNNQFYVKSIDPYSKKSSQSKYYDVTFIDQPPSLEISNPQDGKKYYEANLTVEGTTEKEVFVKINNIPVVIKADGSFTYSLTLNKGENKIKVLATDLAGNVTETELTVTYVE